MSKISDKQVQQTLQPYLNAGERLLHWAYGVKQPPILVIALLMSLAILPGVIAVLLLTKHYYVGLTDQRLIVIRISGTLNVKGVATYELQELPPVKASTGLIFTHIAIKSTTHPFVAKYHRMGMPNNRHHAMAIASTLQKSPG